MNGKRPEYIRTRTAKDLDELDKGGHLMVSTSKELPSRSKRPDPILELQLAMATSSINHEYALIEIEQTVDRDRLEELEHYLDQCREKYTEARTRLTLLSPTTVEQFERDLAYQKKTTLRQYHV